MSYTEREYYDVYEEMRKWYQDKQNDRQYRMLRKKTPHNQEYTEPFDTQTAKLHQKFNECHDILKSLNWWFAPENIKFMAEKYSNLRFKINENWYIKILNDSVTIIF